MKIDPTAGLEVCGFCGERRGTATIHYPVNPEQGGEDVRKIRICFVCGADIVRNATMCQSQSVSEGP